MATLTSKLHKETKATFKLELRNCYQALKEEVVVPDLCTFRCWTVTEEEEEILGFREDCIQQGTWDKISEIKQMKEEMSFPR